MLQNIGLDFRHGLRSLRATPAATIGAILTLTLGIGMSTAVFGVVNGVLLKPLAFAHESRLITICERYPGSTPGWCSISPPTLEDIAAGMKSIDAIGLGRQWPYHLATARGAVAIQGGLATPEMFTALSVRPEKGRLFDRSELIGRQSTVALITHESWQRRFGGEPGIVGRVLDLDNDAVRIIGVLPPGFAPPRIEGVEVWRPLHVNPRDEANREWRGFIAFGRLREGVSANVARQELAAITSRVRDAHFRTVPNWDLQLVGLRDLVVRDTRTRLLVFMGAVLVVLMIGCVNVANLLLARAATRGREMALRTALGATRGRIVRALLIEAFVLAGVGAVGGVALAIAASRGFIALAPVGIPRLDQIHIDARVLSFSIGLAVVCTIVFGLVPALRAARVDLSSALPGSGRTTSHRTGKLSRILVVVELGLAVTLVAAAGVLTRSFAGLTAWRPGFEQEHLLTFSLFAPSSKYSTKALVGGLWKRVEFELLSLPGVADAGTASQGPLFGARETWEMQGVRRGMPFSASVRWADVGPSFFPALGVPLVRGRALSEADTPESPLVGLVNESLARSFWPDEDPIGKTLVFPRGDERASFTIVGVVRDVPQVRPDAPVEPQLYWSNRQLPRPFTFVLVRTTVPPAAVVSAIRSRIKTIDRDLEPTSILTMSDLVASELRTPRFTMLLVLVFGGAALLLAAIGTYSLLSFGVSQRTREIGIRLALGAERRSIILDVASSGLMLASGGLVLGLAGALLAGRAIRGMVAGVSATDPFTLGATTVVLIAVAALASTFPAWRASRVDPNTALRTDN